jgi:hypothetical protein
MMAEHHRLKAKHEATPCTWPEGPRLSGGSAQAQRSHKEDERAFIADVGLFIKRLNWWEQIIYIMHYDMDRHCSIADIHQRLCIQHRANVNETVRHGNPQPIFPKELAFPHFIYKEIKRLRLKASDHFTDNGMIGEDREV